MLPLLGDQFLQLKPYPISCLWLFGTSQPLEYNWVRLRAGKLVQVLKLCLCHAKLCCICMRVEVCLHFLFNLSSSSVTSLPSNLSVKFRNGANALFLLLHNCIWTCPKSCMLEPIFSIVACKFQDLQFGNWMSLAGMESAWSILAVCANSNQISVNF